MKHTILAVAGLVLALAGAAGAQLTNPGFEQVDAGGWAANWVRWPDKSPEPGAVSIDSNVSHTGERCLRLHHERASSYTRGQQVVQTEPNARYFFRVWVRGEDIVGGPGSMGARLYIEGLGGHDRATERQTGSFGWKELTLGPLPSGQGGPITVMCYLHEATGTVWYDDVQVIKVTPDFDKQLAQQHAVDRFRADLDLALTAAAAAKDEAARQELVKLGESLDLASLPEKLDYRAGPPYFPAHAEVFAALARLNARRLPGQSLAVWGADPFAPLPVLGLVPGAAAATARVVMGTDERDQAVVNLCHLGARPTRLRVGVAGLDQPGAPQVTLREVVHVATGGGLMIADALPRLPRRGDDFVMELAPGVFRQLWLDVSSAGAKPGRYQGQVVLRRAAGPAVNVPLTVEVLPVALPAQLPIATWNYSYTNWPLTQGRWDQARRDLAAHHINAYCWPSWLIPWPQFDAAGKLLPLDWSAFDGALKTHDNIQWLLLWPGFEWDDNLKLRQDLEVGSPLWQARFTVWFQALIAGLKERGFGYDRIAWYLTDEPTTAKRVSQTVAAGQAIRQADPQARIVENPYGACTRPLLAQMDPVVDIWCPELSWGTTDEWEFFKDQPRPMWTYQVISKEADPFTRHRLSFWTCWQRGLSGQGFWCYADCGGSNWDPRDADRDGYAVVYDGDPEELIPSKRWEAWREGVEDYTALWRLAQAQPRAAAQLQQQVGELLADPTPEKLARLREQVLRQEAAGR